MKAVTGSVMEPADDDVPAEATHLAPEGKTYCSDSCLGWFIKLVTEAGRGPKGMVLADLCGHLSSHVG